MYEMRIYASGWKNGSGYTYTDNLIHICQIDNPDENKNIDWTAIVGIDNIGIDEWKESHSYDDYDVEWKAVIFEIDEDENENEIWKTTIYESEIVENY